MARIYRAKATDVERQAGRCIGAPASPPKDGRAWGHLGVKVLAALGALAVCLAILLSPDSLWNQYRRNPHRHPYIPNCSFAGYHGGEVPLPEAPVFVDVREKGAIGDGRADDTAGFQKAIAQAVRAGGGVIYVPGGTYRLSDTLLLPASGLVLRGEGAERTRLHFTKSLADLRGPSPRWSFLGGLVWAAPGTSLPTSEPRARIPVTHSAQQGDTWVTVGPVAAKALSEGQKVRMRWVGDATLARHIYGAGCPEYDWRTWAFYHEGTLEWCWPNQVVRVVEGQVELAKPLRLDIRPGWQVTLEAPWLRLEQVGVERLTIEMPVHKRPAHLRDPGFNGIFFERVLNGWVRDVRIVNADNGVILEESSQITVTGLRTLGAAGHHATSWRLFSHDNLMEDFRIENPVHHGIGSQDLASGNVWRRGYMAHGTLDCHCGMPFDSIRTDITIEKCDGSGGGAATGGPFAGRRMVCWNIRIMTPGGKGEALFVNPEQYSMGAIVGVQGLTEKLRQRLWHMPPGDKHTIVVGKGQQPRPPDLYEAQRRLRRESSRLDSSPPSRPEFWGHDIQLITSSRKAPAVCRRACARRAASPRPSRARPSDTAPP